MSPLAAFALAVGASALGCVLAIVLLAALIFAVLAAHPENRGASDAS